MLSERSTSRSKQFQAEKREQRRENVFASFQFAVAAVEGGAGGRWSVEGGRGGE